MADVDEGEGAGRRRWLSMAAGWVRWAREVVVVGGGGRVGSFKVNNLKAESLWGGAKGDDRNTIDIDMNIPSSQLVPVYGVLSSPNHRGERLCPPVPWIFDKDART